VRFLSQNLRIAMIGVRNDLSSRRIVVADHRRISWSQEKITNRSRGMEPGRGWHVSGVPRGGALHGARAASYLARYLASTAWGELATHRLLLFGVVIGGDEARKPTPAVRRMSYQAEISRASPTAILMVMDQSASMNHRLKSGQSKAAFLADVLNKTL